MALNHSDLSQILLAVRMASRRSHRTSPRSWRTSALDLDLLARHPGLLAFHRLPVSKGYCGKLGTRVALGNVAPFPPAARRLPGPERWQGCSSLLSGLEQSACRSMSPPCSHTALSKRRCLEAIRDILFFFPSLPDNFSRRTCRRPPPLLKNFAYS